MSNSPPLNLELSVDLNRIASSFSSGLVGNPPLVASVLREISQEDLVTLATTPKGSTTGVLKKIRSIHHSVARLLASGMKAVQVSATVGMCSSRISILKNDPAFQELLEFYENSEADAYVDVRGKMVSLGSDAAAELHDRILEDPEAVSTKNLIDVLTASLDRGGHSPVHKTESLTAVLSKQDIIEIKKAAASSGLVHDKFEVTQNAMQENNRTEVGEAPSGTPNENTKTEETSGLQSEGDNL